MARYAVALGSNVGDRLGHLRAALDELGRLGRVTEVSSLYETEPVGGPEQGRYLNAVAVVDSDLEPMALLERLLEIERRRDRVRDQRWGPRTLDLDIVASDGPAVAGPHLEVPHPRAHERGFVLAPLVDVWADAALADGSIAIEALERVDRSGLGRWRGDWTVDAPQLGPQAVAWVAAQFVLFGAWLAIVLVAPRADPSPAWVAVGAASAVAGLAVMEWARRSLGRELTPFPQPRRRPALVDSGAYRLVRHPIYAGVVLLLAGAAIGVGSPAGVLAALGIGLFFAAKARVEERALSIGVPGYSEYMDRVPARFVPVGRTRGERHER